MTGAPPAAAGDGNGLRPKPWRWNAGPGWSRLFGRLYRLRPAPGFLAAAPALFLLAWYAVGAVAEHARHDRAAGEDRPLDAELFQLHLHDRLTRDLRALRQSPQLRSSDLPTVALTLGADELEALAACDITEGPSAYVTGTLRFERGLFRVQVRYRGQESWHRDYPQKSWKMRVLDGGRVHGTATFNLINSPEPLAFDEQLVLDVAREQGLLTPAAFPVRMLFNDTGMGVYFFVAQPDTDLLRSSDRVPGPLYSGNDASTHPETGVSRLWEDAQYWKQVDADEGGVPADAAPLERLLALVGSGSQAEFARFARDHLDLRRLALLDAINVVFGVDRMDFGRNHKLVLDPVTGRFEPVASDFRGWEHTRDLNRVEHPLLIRLKELPEYLTARNRQVWRLLHGPCSLEAVRERARRTVDELAQDQAADPFWDAFDLLPAGDGYFEDMIRPMTAERQELVLAGRLDEFERRVAYLREELSKPGSTWTRRTATDGGVLLEAAVDGPAGYRLDEVRVEWSAGCVPERWRMSAERTGGAGKAGTTGEWAAGQAVRPGWPLYPGTVLEARKPHPTRGNVVSATDERTYRFRLEAGGCVASAVHVRTTNLVTGGVEQRMAAAPASSGVAADEPLACAETAPGLVPGRRSLHPWCLPAEPRRFVRLGPGTVRVDETREYRPGETVSIAPGTTVELAKGASLVFRGPLFAVGTAEAPIRFVAQDKRWGGLALLGPGTAGSRLVHFEVDGATAPEVPLTTTPSAVDIQDTAAVVVAHGRIRGGKKQAETFRAAYVRGLLLGDLELREARGDALDLEFVLGAIQGLTVVDAGQEALDVNGGRVTLADARLLDCGANAISVGSGARLRAARVLVAGSRTGLLVKAGSRVRLVDVLFERTGTAAVVRVSGENWPGDSRLQLERTHASGCGAGLLVEDGALDPRPDLQSGLPGDALRRLRESLGLAAWSELDGVLRRWREELP
ncbi:MAG: CotH kinase family protein [Deltaproteobacteria bacterium]|nr:CotH kinase family protein [Deltaproteobacteria bacterium]